MTNSTTSKSESERSVSHDRAESSATAPTPALPRREREKYTALTTAVSRREREEVTATTTAVSGSEGEKTASNWLTELADNRRNTLALLANSANQSHRWAAAAAACAMAHIVAAGHSLLQARDLCEEGGWLRWLRNNFKGSVRTAQRYMRVARHLPASGIDPTRVSHQSQRAFLRSIRGVVFGEPDAAAKDEPTVPPPAQSDAAAADNPEARRRLSFIAARRLRKLAGEVAAIAGGTDRAASGNHAAELVERINALAADLLLDLGEGSSADYGGTGAEVYFIEAVGADRVKIGVSRAVSKRFKQLAVSFPGPLALLGKVAGGRAREKSLHWRLANFHIGGEWFHLTPGVRRVLREVIDDEPE